MAWLVNYTNTSLAQEGLQIVSETLPNSKLAISIAAGCVSLAAYFYFSGRDGCVYSRPDLLYSDSSSFKETVDKSFRKLLEKKVIKTSFLYSKEEEKEKLSKQISKGICFGRAIAFLKLADKYPTASKVELVKKIKLEKVIYIQFLHTTLSSKIKSTPPPNLNWFPSNEDCTCAIPWKEKIRVFYDVVLETEEQWIKTFGEFIHSKSIFGRLSFKVNRLSSHTFALWHTNNTYGFYDHANLYEFSNLTKFVKAIRNNILNFRNYYIENEPETALETPFFPIAVHLKRNS